MLVEADGLIIVTVEQTFAVEPGLIDQPRQMHETAEPIIGTAWTQFLHLGPS